MRRTILTVLAILLASAFAPTAAASSSAIRFDFPDGALQGDATVPVNVTLYVNDFMCHDTRDFVVMLSANATEGVKATFAKTNLTYTTNVRAYFGEPFTQTQTVNLTVRALQAGEVELTAWMDAAETGPCFAPDGFQPSRTSVVLRVDAATAPPTTPTAPTPTTNETAPDDNATNETPPTPATPRPTGAICPPGEVCGPIGDYDAPQESARESPGAGLLLATVALAAGAVALRRKT